METLWIIFKNVEKACHIFLFPLVCSCLPFHPLTHVILIPPRDIKLFDEVLRTKLIPTVQQESMRKVWKSVSSRDMPKQKVLKLAHLFIAIRPKISILVSSPIHFSLCTLYNPCCHPYSLVTPHNFVFFLLLIFFLFSPGHTHTNANYCCLHVSCYWW